MVNMKMWVKVLIFTMTNLFSFLSLGMCPPDDFGFNYDYINPKVDIQWTDQAFIVKNKSLTITDSFPSFCSDINDNLAKSKSLNPNQVFIIIGEFMTFINWDDSDQDMLSEGYFKVALIQSDGVIDLKNTGWIHMDDLHEMKTSGQIEKKSRLALGCDPG